MEVSEAVVVYDGRGVTTRVSRLTPTAMTVFADVTPTAGENVTVFIDGVGKMASTVTYAEPPRIELSFLTDTQEQWRQLQALRRGLV